MRVRRFGLFYSFFILFFLLFNVLVFFTILYFQLHVLLCVLDESLFNGDLGNDETVKEMGEIC